MIKFACVTGADHGLGLAFVESLLQRNYSVIAGKYLSSSKKLEQLAEQYSSQLFIVDLDISSSESVATAATEIRNLTSTLDLLINNAAILGDIHTKVTEPLNFQEMQDVFNVNALGTLRVTNALIPLVLKSETKLIANISSEAGSIGTCWRDSWFAYCMSKAALNMQSALIHNELKQSGGQVMVFHPGRVQTYMQGALDEGGNLTPAEASNHILHWISKHKDFMSERPVFLNYQGEELVW